MKIVFHDAVGILLFFIVSCSNNDPTSLENALRLAGNNRCELEHVLNHYRNGNDSLKYQAALFLIRNMSGHYTTTSKDIDEFEAAFHDGLESMKEPEHYYADRYINGKILRTRTEKVWNEVIREYGAPSSFRLHEVIDNKRITSQMLIENIYLAFEAYKYPWAKHLSFEQFCEYVLPYRFSDEPLESWRPFFMERYRWVTDSLDNQSDPVEVCTLINNDIASWFEFDGMFNDYPRTFSASLLIKSRIGSCIGQAEIATFAMRAMGLAITHNSIPHWGNRSKGHDFCSVLSKEGKWIDFLGGELPPGKNEIRDRATKVYRETFSIRPFESAEKLSRYLGVDLTKNIDVTDQHIPVSPVSLDMANSGNEGDYVYLCVFDNQRWVPVSYCQISNKKCLFNKMGRNIVYLPVYYVRNKQYSTSPPFLLDTNGLIKPFIDMQQNLPEVFLYRKYPISQRMTAFSKHMIGGKFQAANTPDFNNAIDLYSIESTPESYLKFYPIEKGSYRYVRYLFPPFVPGSSEGNVAELAFKGFDKNHQEIILKDEYLGSPEVKESQFSILFDGKLDDYVIISIADTFIADYPNRAIAIPQVKPLWVGFDLKLPYEITQIGYCPRNDTNNLYEHCKYELFYWDNRWVSLGIRAVKNNCLIYSNVPAGCLLLLRNYTEGTEERPFVMENEQQVFW